MNNIIKNSKNYFLSSISNETLEKVFIIVAASPFLMFLTERISDIANNALDKGYNFSCNAKEMSLDLTKSS